MLIERAKELSNITVRVGKKFSLLCTLKKFRYFYVTHFNLQVNSLDLGYSRILFHNKNIVRDWTTR